MGVVVLARYGLTCSLAFGGTAGARACRSAGDVLRYREWTDLHL
jgi:hypothetical protein